jgi:hypothetical protein
MVDVGQLYGPGGGGCDGSDAGGGAHSGRHGKRGGAIEVGERSGDLWESEEERGCALRPRR